MKISNSNCKEPVIIQGGMGVAVSNWRLARCVSKTGQLGVVSGTALDTVLARRLQDGDEDGDMRRALNSFPDRSMAERVLQKYFVAGGKEKNQPYKSPPMFRQQPDASHLELTVVANFVEVFLAKEGHDGIVGINYLEKIQLPTLPSLYGAMLASVDYVLIGAGIPRAIPAVLDKLANHEAVSLRLNVDGANPEDNFETRFDPGTLMTGEKHPIVRPKFLAIVASAVLARTMAKKSSGAVHGFVLENYRAGGHNAPPRGGSQLDQRGEPIYSERDEIALEEIKKLGLPFWLAGCYGYPEKVEEAMQLGAQGVQAGTIFALSDESGIEQNLKERIIQSVVDGNAEVFTDPQASPTGFPFKVLKMEGTISEDDTYNARQRVCDLGYLRTAYKKADGALGFRCAGEPTDVYVQKGGRLEDTAGRKCLCNHLLSNVGIPQARPHYHEKALVTIGEDLTQVLRILTGNSTHYSAADVVRYLLGSVTAAAN